MMNVNLIQERDTVACQMTPDRLLVLLRTLEREIKFNQLNMDELVHLASNLLTMIQEDEFDEHLSDNDGWIKALRIIRDYPDLKIFNKSALIEYIMNQKMEEEDRARY